MVDPVSALDVAALPVKMIVFCLLCFAYSNKDRESNITKKYERNPIIGVSISNVTLD